MEFILKPVEKFITVEAFNDAIDALRPAGFVFAGEMHDFWEAVFVESGRATASAEEQVFSLCRDQLLFHKPNEFHRIRTEGSKPAHLRIISFVATGKGMNDFCRKCYNLSESEIENYLKIFSLIEKACKDHNSTTPQISAVSSSKAAAALESFLLDLREKNAAERKESSLNEQRYKEIVTVMKENCEKWLNTPDIAALCHMSTSNMKRIFSLYCDMGISKYFLTLKLRRACELLRKGQSVAYVSEKLNFCSVNYFHTVFKREIGITPGEYIFRQ